MFNQIIELTECSLYIFEIMHTSRGIDDDSKLLVQSTKNNTISKKIVHVTTQFKKKLFSIVIGWRTHILY